MVAYNIILFFLSVFSIGTVVSAEVTFDTCEVTKRIESGWVCGTKRVAQNGAPYDSFRGIPYAKQPLGELRFQELQPTESWDGLLDATTEGPACHQHDVYYGSLMQPQGFSEACIHANVHVPTNVTNGPQSGLPIFVFMHGGSLICGSGDADFNGPEYLVGKEIIVITFNYRLDVLGFLSLGTSKIPGNNGIRDALTLLRWVKRNARYFGGDPDEVTLAGQSSGSNVVHLLTLTPHAKGLFKRLWLTGGNAIPNDFTTVPAAAKNVATGLLKRLGLNDLDYDTVHDRLIQMPIDQIQNASKALLADGLSTFMPVQDSGLPGVTSLIPEDPENLVAKGNGDDIPIVIGYNNNECGTLRPRLESLDPIGQYQSNPASLTYIHWLYKFPKNVTKIIGEKMAEKYFNGEPTMDKYIDLCSDTLIVYPALKYVRDRMARGGAPIYIYKFSYAPKYSVLKLGLNLVYDGAGHMEDMNHFLKVNSFKVPQNDDDDNMKDWTSDMVANFVKTGSPAPGSSWPPQSSQSLQYQRLAIPKEYQNTVLDANDQETLSFFDSLLTYQ